MKMKENTKNEQLKITLKTFFGMEDVLSDELEELGYTVENKLNRAVQLSGTWKDVYFLNTHVRCAISILVELASFKIKHEDELYKYCKKVKWTELFDISKSFAVKGAIFSKHFNHSQYPFLVVKDAIVDQFREITGERPNVNIKKPQVLFDLYINNDAVTLSVNTSGVPLFQRGYREETGIAPLNEVVAAGLIRMSGWDRKSTFIDPFCGSGTLLIEAAMLACDIPPSVERQHFAFKNLKNFDNEYWEELQNGMKRVVRELPCEIKGCDISDEMVLKSRRNLRTFSFGRFIDIRQGDFTSMSISSDKGTMVTNPPYGERMGDEIDDLYERIGSWMKHDLPGFSCWILSSNMEAFKFIGLKPTQKVKVYNGDLDCSFRNFEIYSGSKKNNISND